MKTRFTLPFLFILSAVLLQSCSAPKNIIKLQPEAENIGRWLYGQHYVADSLNGVISALAAEMKCIAVPEKQALNLNKFIVAHQVLESLSEFNVELLTDL